MIKFRATGEKGQMVGFGLVPGSLDLLREGKPIHVKLSDMGIDTDIEVLIFFGESEKEIYRRMKAMGAVTDETEIRVGS